MSRPLHRLAGNEHGSTAIEFAFAVPVLVTLIWSMFQFGILFQANAGVQHALGEGARRATLYDMTTVDRRPTDASIKAIITSAKFGVGNGTWDEPQITTDNAAGTKTITVSYSQPLNFLFFDGPSVTITKAKTVYLSE